jgi:putative transmembrane protein
MSKFWQYALLFLGCVLAQVFIFDNIQLWGFVVPYIYVLFILVLPNNISRPFLYVLGFLLGLSVDLFSSTLCLHAAATTFMAFLRAPLISFTTTQQQLLKTPFPVLRAMGFAWTARLIIILVLAHHLLLHFLSSAPVFATPWFTLLRVVGNVFVSSVVLLIAEFFIYPPLDRVKN